MATNFSPCKGSYVLNQFPSNVMFGMNGFHVSASGAIQGHHGPLVYYSQNKFEILVTFFLLSASALNNDQCKILSFGKELIIYQTTTYYIDPSSNHLQTSKCYSKIWVQHDLVVKCLTHNPGVLDLSRSGSPAFCHGSVLGQDASEPPPSTGVTQE